MFFVLSGFLLSRPYLTSAQPGQPPRKIFLPTFYLRRFTRIWLPWFFAFVLSALAQVVFFRDWTTNPPTNEWFRQFWHVPLTFENTLRQCLFILHDPKVQLLNQDWSLGVELKASILMPLFIFLCGVWSPWSLLAISTLLVVFTSMGPSYCSFILGVILAKHGSQLLPGLQTKPMLVKAWMHLLNLWGVQRTIWLLPLNFLASVGLTLILATLCHLWVEKPCIELGHTLSRKIQAKYAKS